MSVYSAPKPKLLYFLSDLHPVYNGTSKLSIMFWKVIYKKLNNEFEIYLYIPESTYLFFKREFEEAQHVIFTGMEIHEKFALAFKPFQIYGFEDLILLNKIALKYIYNVLDIISIRCDYLSSAYRNYAMRMASRWADKILCISNYTMHDSNAYYNSDIEMKTVYPWAIKDYIDIKQESYDDNYILVVGNKYGHKVVDWSIEKLEIDMPIYILGDGADIIHKKSVRIFHTGLLSENKVTDLYRKASVVIFPSHYEGFGIPILEAAGFRKPILVHDNSCSREIIDQYQIQNVWFYKTFDELSTLVQEIKKKKTIKTVSNISWDTISDQLIKTLRQVYERQLDIDHLQKRWQSINTLEIIKKHYGVQTNIKQIVIDKIISHIKKNPLLYKLAKIGVNITGKIIK